MTGEELHNFCKFLYSQIQSKDEVISRLTANIKELTDQTRAFTDTKRKLQTAETLLTDANEKKRQLEAERKMNAKERKDLEDEIALLRSDLYCGTKS